jgi:LuxR family maltose regulon positive regulatory protein
VIAHRPRGAHDPPPVAAATRVEMPPAPVSEAEFTLKSTPPRLPRATLARARLANFHADVQERTAVCVVAPAGFGKTTLLLQWRQRWLAQGAVVAWVDADALDDAARLVAALRHALRDAVGHAGLGAHAARFAGEPGRPLDDLTATLAAIAGLGVETVLLLDEAERLPAATVAGALRYLLLNAPANLRVVLGSRVRLPLPTAELAAHGQYAALGVDELRLRLEETVELLALRPGARLGLDERVRLHDAVEGWPLGLQLAIAAIEHEADPAAAIARLSARRGHLQDYFVETLDAQLPAADLALLVRVAILDHVDADRCRALTGATDAADVLQRLLHATPILMADEAQAVFRLHALARDHLLARFERLPAAERAALHARACDWFVAHDRFHDAARHALAAGDEARAHDLAVRSLWTLGTEGKLAEANAWLARIPPAEVARDVPMRLMAAWIHALGTRSAEALQAANAIADDPDTAPGLRRLALRVSGAAAMNLDHVASIDGLVARWPASDAGDDDPLYVATPLNGEAFTAYHAGATAQARALAARVLALGDAGSMRLAAAYAQALVGLCWLRDGDVLQAERALGPALERAEREDGRRGVVPCLFAAVLAAAMLDRDAPEAALTLLADRIDIVEGLPPDIVLLAYRALARATQALGDERRSLLALEGLDALGRRRNLPRLRAHALAERIRVHALQARHDTVARLLPELDAAVAALAHDDYAPLRPRVGLIAAIARAHAALARDALDEAEAHLAQADALARRSHGPRDGLIVQVLRAVLARKRGQATALPMLAEALGLARLGGLVRQLADIHPLAVQMARELPADATAAPPPAVAAPPAPMPPAPTSRQGLLTAKEAEILLLLDKGLSNKSIARLLGISSETVKWHVKNLFAKLSAGTRRHAVDRARLLGLVAG